MGAAVSAAGGGRRPGPSPFTCSAPTTTSASPAACPLPPAAHRPHWVLWLLSIIVFAFFGLILMASLDLEETGAQVAFAICDVDSPGCC